MMSEPRSGATTDRMAGLIDKAADGLMLVAVLCLLFMVGLIVVDVLLGITLNIRIFGAYEIVGLLMAPVAFLPLGKTLLKGQHLTVDLLDNLISVGASRTLHLLGLAMTVGFVILLTVLTFGRAMESVSLNEVSLDRGIPLIFLIMPIFVGFAAIAICSGFLIIRDLRARLPRRDH
jgi:TRAP-type C4-dicarboxylate transport system permease small subunit